MTSTSTGQTGENSLRIIRPLSQPKLRETNLVQDMWNGRIFVVSTIPIIPKGDGTDYESDSMYKKYAAIVNPCLIQMHPEYSPDTTENNQIRIALPYYMKGSLGTILSKEKEGKHPFEWTPTIKSITAFGIAIGIKSLDSIGLVHGRLTPNNVLFSQRYEPILTDYWLAETISNEAEKSPESQTFDPPEKTSSTDMWSFSAIIAAMSRRSPSFNGSAATHELKEPLGSLITDIINGKQTNHTTIDTILNTMLKVQGAFINTDPSVFNSYTQKLTNAKVQRNFMKTIPIPPYIDEKILADTYRTLADDGDEKAQLLNGSIRREGRGCSVNKSAALRSFKAAADAGIPEAQYHASVIMSVKPKNQKVRQECLELLQRSAASGFADAQFRLAGMLIRGDGIKQDVAHAISMLESAANRGHLQSQLLLAQLYSGNGPIRANKVRAAEFMRMAAYQHDCDSQLAYAKFLSEVDIKKNMKEVRSLLIRAADQGSQEAQELITKYITDGRLEVDSPLDKVRFLRLGAQRNDEAAKRMFSELITSGEVPPESDEEAARYFKIAADGGDDKAIVRYADLLMSGRGVEKDRAEGLRYLRRSADAGNVESIYRFAQACYEGSERGDRFEDRENRNTARAYMRKAADLKHVGAQTAYARMITDEQPEVARAYLEEAGEKGSADALYELALLHLRQRPIKGVSREAGAEYMRRAADLGNSKAMLKYGRLCLRNRGVGGDEERAAEYYQRAVEAGNPKAMVRFGEMLADGEGVEADPERAARIFEMAVRYTEYPALAAQARYDLGLLYMTGRGVEKDEKRAAQYMRQAADARHRAAAMEYVRMLLDGCGVTRSENIAQYYMQQNRDSVNNEEEDYHSEDEDDIDDFDADEELGDGEPSIRHIAAKLMRDLSLPGETLFSPNTTNQLVID